MHHKISCKIIIIVSYIFLSSFLFLFLVDTLDYTFSFVFIPLSLSLSLSYHFYLKKVHKLFTLKKDIILSKLHKSKPALVAKQTKLID